MTRILKAGTTNVSVVIRIIDSTNGTPETGVVWNTAGIDLKYRREGAVNTAIVEADLATPALDDPHLDGGFLLIGNGYYRLDLPDAACAAGVTGVLIHGTVTGMVVIGEYIQLVAYDPFDGAELGLTSLGLVTAARMGALTDWINGGRLDLLLDAIKAVTDKLLLLDAGAPSTWAHGSFGDRLVSKDANRSFDSNTDSLEAIRDRLDTVENLVDDLETRLTAARAGYLDELAAANLPADIDTLVGRLTAARAAVLTDWIDGGRLDLLLDAIPTTAMRGTDNAALAATALSTAVWTAARAGVLTDWINGGRLDLLLDAIPTTAMRGTDNAALAATALSTATWTAARAAALTDLIDGGRLDLLIDAIKIVTDALTSAAATKLALSAGTIVTGAAAAGTLSTTQMTTDLTEATNDHYNGRIVIWTSGVLQNQATDITDYDGATKMLTFTATTEAPTAADTFVIV